MGYQFDFDWGESWTVTENDFEWDREYWYKVLARHIHFFREKVREVKHLGFVTAVTIRLYGEYKGVVTVSDNYVHYIMHDPDEECCWLVSEL